MGLLIQNFVTAVMGAIAPAWAAFWGGVQDIVHNIFAALGLGG